MTPNLARYERIAPFYDLLELPFERKRYTALRPLMFQDLGGELLDAGIGTGRRFVARLWQPWMSWAYGASFDRQTEKYVPAAGLELIESRYVVDDLVKMLTLRSR